MFANSAAMSFLNRKKSQKEDIARDKSDISFFLSMHFKYSLTIKRMNYDRPTDKQKNLSRQGRCARKPKRKTNNEQATSFLLCEKMLDLMMEILPSILGNRPPSKDNRAFLVAVFHALANGLRWRALPVERGKWRSFYAKFNRWAKRGVWSELFEQLKQRVKGIDLEYIMIDYTAVRNHKSAMEANGGNQCIGRTAGGPTTKMRMIVDGAETRPVSPSQRAMSVIQRRHSV